MADAVWLTRLALGSYRNIRHLRLDPSPRFNIICGANAQGKTNILESVSLLSTGRVLRGSKESQAVMQGESDAQVYGRVASLDTEILIELREGVKKRVSVNGAALARASDVLGRLPTVCFSSSDLCIVNGEPADRRHFLDSELSQLYPSYLRSLTIYKRALEQRNSLLRLAQDRYVDEASFEVWEAQLAEHGGPMRAVRDSWVAGLSSAAEIAQARLGNGERINLRLELKDEGDLGVHLASTRDQDIARGSTSWGPHRDELVISVGGRLARHFASQGQQRTAVIALKLAVLQRAKEALGTPPVLLLDDIFSDLDQDRRQALVGVALEEGGQVFLTCTEAEQAGVELVRNSAIWRIQGGELTV